MKTFEKYLEEDCWEPEGVLDDDMPDAFEAWLEGLDTQEVMDYAEEWGKELQKNKNVCRFCKSATCNKSVIGCWHNEKKEETWKERFDNFLQFHKGKSITEIPNEVANFIQMILDEKKCELCDEENCNRIRHFKK
jgi:hypothetical protein